MTLVHETPLDAALQKVDAWREEAKRVDQHDRAAEQSEPLPRDRFEQFLERAASAGQRDHRVDLVDHQALALVQVIYDEQLAQAAMTPFEVVHETRQDADHAAAFAERRVRKMAHRADAAAAVYQRHPVARQCAAEARAGVVIGGIALAARRAINADSLDSHRAIVSDRFAVIQCAASRALFLPLDSS